MFEAALFSLDVSSPDSGWYLDLGATQHLSGNRSNFSTLDEYSGNIKIVGGQIHPISGRSNVHFSLPSGEIEDVHGVLYVPGQKKNLLLIGSFTDRGIVACFDDHQCILYSKNHK